MLRRSDNGEYAKLVGNSSEKNLKANAEDFLVLLDSAFEKALYYQVCHMGHIAAEVAMKAVYAKNNGTEHPWGHELSDICIFEYAPGRNLFADIATDSTINAHYLLIKTAWAMQDRYQRKSVKLEDAASYQVAYREVTKWIFTTYL